METESRQFTRWFGNWKKFPKDASKIVNPDGTPKVMYHGSPAKFTIFDKKNELDPVGATNNLRGLAAKIKLIGGNCTTDIGKSQAEF